MNAADPADSQPRKDAGGYRPAPGHGPLVRTDVIDVYIFRRATDALADPYDPCDGAQFLQVYRARKPLQDTWQPVMGHIEPGESAPRAALREMHEETGLAWGHPAFRGLWALEQVHPFYLAAIDAVVMSPRFAAEAAPGWNPTLNDEHHAHRWVAWSEAWKSFMWPGQLGACREIIDHLLRAGAPASSALRITENPSAPS